MCRAARSASSPRRLQELFGQALSRVHAVGSEWNGPQYPAFAHREQLIRIIGAAVLAALAFFFGREARRSFALR